MNNHPNQWFLDICPDDWRDKDYFIENALFRGLIHFWENEDGKISTQLQTSIDADEYGMTVVEHLRHVEFYQNMYCALNDAYEFAKIWAACQDEFDKSFTQTEELDYATATKHLQSIVKYRGKMWT